MVRDLGIYDEGIVIVGAMRWIAGEIPHRDFYSNYGPANYAVVSSIISIFGKSMIAIRLYAVFMMAAVVALTFRLLISRTTLAFCLLGTGLCGSFIFGSPFYLYSIFPVTALALLGTHFLLPLGSEITKKQALLAGLCAGVAALFRYDSGFFILVAHYIVILVLAGPDNFSRRLRQTLSLLLAYLIGSLAAFAPFATWYLMAAPLGPFVHDIFEYPLKYYGRMRGLPFPDVPALINNPLNLGVYFPVLALTLAVVKLWLSRSTRKIERHVSSADALFVATVALTIVLFYKGWVRVETVHMLMSIIPATLLVALALQDFWSQHKAALVFILLPIVWLAPAAGFALQVLQDVRDPLRTLGGWALLSSSDREQCAGQVDISPLRLAPKYAAVGQFLKQHTSESERIFVGLDQHDKTFANAISLYIAADRLPATRWHQFDPGLQNRANVQSEIIANLDKYKTEWIVRDFSFNSIHEPNESSNSSGVLLLDRFIADRYRPVARSENVVILRSKNADYLDFKNNSVCNNLFL